MPGSRLPIRSRARPYSGGNGESVVLSWRVMRTLATFIPARPSDVAGMPSGCSPSTESSSSPTMLRSRRCGVSTPTFLAEPPPPLGASTWQCFTSLRLSSTGRHWWHRSHGPRSGRLSLPWSGLAPLAQMGSGLRSTRLPGRLSQAICSASSTTSTPAQRASTESTGPSSPCCPKRKACRLPGISIPSLSRTGT